MVREPSGRQGPHAPKGPRVKLSQVVALDPKLADILEKHKVRKPRTVDKVENLEKWIASRGWRLAIAQGSGDGTHAKIELPGPDGLLSFEATDTTMALAITVALCQALEEGPRQANFMDAEFGAEPDAAGRDLPLFRDHAAADVDSDRYMAPDIFHADEADFRGKADDLDDEPDDDGELVHGMPPDVDEPAGGFATMSYDGDTLLYHVSPADDRLWREYPVDILRWSDGTEPRFEPAAIADGADPDAVEPEGWYLAYGFDYDAELGLIRDPQQNKTYWARVMPKHHGFRDAAPLSSARRALDKPQLVDENAWLQDLPAALEIEYDAGGAWTFYLKPGFVYIIADGAIYDAQAKKVWDRAFPQLGTADHPPVPDVPELTAELARRQSVAWQLQTIGEFGNMFVDGDTLEYCVDRPNIETGENEEIAVDQAEVEAAFQRARAAGRIPAPLSGDEDGAALDDQPAIESEPMPDMGDFTGDRLDDLARSYAADMPDPIAGDDPERAANEQQEVDRLAEDHGEHPDQSAGEDEADIFLEDNMLQVAAYVRQNYPALSPRDAIRLVGDLQKQYRTIANFRAQLMRGDALQSMPAEEVAALAADAVAIGEALQGKGAADVEPVAGNPERWGEPDLEESVSAQDAAEAAQLDAPRPVYCEAVSAAAGVVCGNKAESVPGMHVALCPSHLGYARKHGSVRVDGDRIIWHDGAHWTLNLAAAPAETIATAADLGKSRTTRTAAPAHDVEVPAVAPNAPESPETLRKQLDELGVIWSGNVPDLPPTGRGRPSKARIEQEEKFPDLARRYLELTGGQQSGRIVNGGILPLVGPGTPDMVLEEILR